MLHSNVNPTNCTEYRLAIALLLGFPEDRYSRSLPKDILDAVYRELLGKDPDGLVHYEIREAIAVFLDMDDPHRFSPADSHFHRDEIVAIYDALKERVEQPLPVSQ